MIGDFFMGIMMHSGEDMQCECEAANLGNRGLDEHLPQFLNCFLDWE